MSVIRFHITAHQACCAAVNSYTNMNNGAELCVFVKGGGCSAAVGVLLQSNVSSIVADSLH